MRLAALAWRGLAARPLRTLLTSAGVALGVAIVAGTLLANQAASEAVARAAQELYGRADLRVRAFDPDGFTPRTITRLRALAGVEVAAPVAERLLTLSTLPGPEEQPPFSLLAIGLRPGEEAEIRDPGLAAGTPLAADQPTNVLVSAAWATEHALGIGDQLLLAGREPGMPALTIVGLLQPVGFGAVNGGDVILLPRETLNETFSVTAPTTYIDMAVAEGRIEDVQAALDRVMNEPFIVETVADAQVQLGRVQSGFAGIAFLLGLVAMAVGAFLVANTLAMTVTERTREIGLLRAAGMTRGQVTGIFIRQAAVIGVVGAVLGAGLGIGLALGMIWFLRSTRALLIGGLPLNPWSIGLAVVLGLAVTLAGAILPLRAAARVTPLDALRPSRQPNRTLGSRLGWVALLEVVAVVIGFALYPIDRGDFSILGAVLAILLLVGGTIVTALALQPLARIVGRPFEWIFGAQGLLGRANLGRDRVRTGLTIGALIVGLASWMALGGVTESARATADRWVASILPGGYAIRFGLPLDIMANGPSIEATEGAAAASPIVEFPAVVVRDGDRLEASMAGIDPALYRSAGALIFVHGQPETAFAALARGGAVLVPDGMARRDELGVGSVIQLGLPGQAPQPFDVAGIIAYTLPGRSADGALLVSLDDAATVFGATSASLWALVPEEGVSDRDFAAAVDRTARMFAGATLTAPQLADDLSRSLDRLIGLFDVLALLAVGIAALGIVNTLALGVEERRREIAILRSHGMTAGGVQAMVVAEAAIMGAVGGLAAAITGMAAAAVVVTIAAPGDFAAGLAIPWPLIAAVVLLGTGIAALAGLYPARLAARTPIVGSLKHFE